MARKRDDTIKLVLRLPSALHRRLERTAARAKRSLNSEMIQRLEDSFDFEGLERLRKAIQRHAWKDFIEQALAQPDDEENQ